MEARLSYWEVPPSVESACQRVVTSPDSVAFVQQPLNFGMMRRRIARPRSQFATDSSSTLGGHPKPTISSLLPPAISGRESSYSACDPLPDGSHDRCLDGYAHNRLPVADPQSSNSGGTALQLLPGLRYR